MHIHVMRNHRRCNINATIGRYVEICGSKMNDEPIALDLMAAIIRLQTWRSQFDEFNFRTVNHLASHQRLFRSLVSYGRNLNGFLGTEFTLVAAHKINRLPRIYKQSKELA